jgi:selenocysteine lyase/cysteine desulfurase
LVAVRHEQFLLDDARIFLNPGSLGVMPRPVLQAVIDSLTSGAVQATDEVPRWGFEKLEPERTEMADFLGCRADELAFTHNCTEALSIIANGLELNSGDEVLMTNQEHGSGTRWRSKRRGTAFGKSIPVTPTHPEELADRLISAIGPKTRVLSLSGITSPTGLILPFNNLSSSPWSVFTVWTALHVRPDPR